MKREIDTDSGGVIPFEVTTLYGARTKRGLVEITLGETKTQLTVGKAREIRDMLTEGIEAAISDELMMRFLVDHVGMPIEQAAGALMAFREMRQGTRGVQRVDG